MTATDIVDVATQPDPAPARRELPSLTWTPRLALSIEELIELQKLKRRLIGEVMREGEHYGTIPGTSKQGEERRKVLFKSGAELLFSAFGLHPELVDAANSPILDATGLDHGGEPFYEYRRACLVWRQTGPGPDDRMLIARAEGSCNSWERKYRTRKGGRLCPGCGKATIRVSTFDNKQGPEWGKGSYWCSNKPDCGAKFAKGDPAIEGQQTGDIPNPDIADLLNTLLKMSDKRAYVAGALIATACSDIFTQDIADDPDDDDRRATGNGRTVDEDGVIHGGAVSVDEASASEMQDADSRGQVPASNGGGVPTSSGDELKERQRAILLTLVDPKNLPPVAGWKAIRVNAMLGSPAFPPQKVFDMLIAEHAKHCPNTTGGKPCLHASVAIATWPSA